MTSARHQHNGFTIIEMSVATGLMAVLALIMGFGWRSLNKAAVDLVARAQLAQEIDCVAASLCRDLGGCIVNSLGQTAPTTTFPICLASSKFSAPLNATQTHQIMWNLDNGDTVTYELDTSDSPDESDKWKHNLVRRYSAPGSVTTFTVAKNVDALTAEWNADGTELIITIDFSCNYKLVDSSGQRLLDSHGNPDRTQSIIKRTCVFVTNMPAPKQSS